MDDSTRSSGGPHTILVLADPNEPQLAMLDALPKETNLAVGNSPAAFERAAADADVIFNWSERRDLLRAVFAMAPQVRWVHSRAAGLDNLLVSGTGGKPRAADQWQRRVQPIVGRIRAGGDSLFREGFPAHDPQPDGRAVGAVRRARDRGTDGGDCGLWRYRARCRGSACRRWACACSP